jgi:hypothetical protein
MFKFALITTAGTVNGSNWNSYCWTANGIPSAGGQVSGVQYVAIGYFSQDATMVYPCSVDLYVTNPLAAKKKTITGQGLTEWGGYGVPTVYAHSLNQTTVFTSYSWQTTAGVINFTMNVYPWA